MNKLLYYWALLIVCMSCHNHGIDKYQKDRKITTNVKDANENIMYANMDENGKLTWVNAELTPTP